MLFNSLEFALFFVVVTCSYWLLPHRARAPLLLAASCLFYTAFIPRYILILGFTIAIDYVAGLLIGRTSGRARRVWLAASIAANVGVLAYFKYFNFLNETLRSLVVMSGHSYPVAPLAIILPIGLSFHTFQSMSYVIEVYRGAQPVERNLLRFALYVMFYPQLVAGPIERPQNLLPQFRIEHAFDYDQAKRGLQLMAWGLFKKVAIADRLAPGVNAVYADPGAYSGAAALMATYLFAVQIYCDFSGYSDIAIGAAQVMGFRLMRNFDRPYASQSIGEFWRRWHISLSTWFRDYVYIPLGGSRRSTGRHAFNLMAVFTLSGLWHGADWTFVVWGALNGFYLVTSVMFSGVRRSIARVSGLAQLPWLHAFVRWAVTFHLIVLSWVFFRASSIDDAITTLRGIVSNAPGLALPYDMMGGRTGVVVVLGMLLGAEALQSRIGIRDFIASRPAFARWPAYVALVMMFLLLGNFASQQQFIYFQF